MSTAQCPVCLEVVKDIKILPTCYHTLCTSCSDSLTLDDSIDCPLCQTRNMLKQHTSQQEEPEKKSPIKKHTMNCESEDGSEATMWCKSCDYCCCEYCWTKIHSIGKFKTHKKSNIEDRNQLKCQTHQNLCEFYCKNCSDFVCRDCCDDSHTNKHSIQPIHSCAEEVKRKLLAIIASEFRNQIHPIKFKYKQINVNMERNVRAIAQKQLEIENLYEENEQLQKLRNEKKKFLEKAKANRKLLKQLLHVQEPADLLSVPKLSLLESRISENINSIFNACLPTLVSQGKIEFTNLNKSDQKPHYSHLISRVDRTTPLPRGISFFDLTEERHDANLVKALLVPDKEEFIPGQTFKKIWFIKNTGNKEWPAGTKFQWVAGDRLSNAEPCVITKVVFPGEIGR